jgi:hypothetical protein
VCHWNVFRNCVSFFLVSAGMQFCELCAQKRHLSILEISSWWKQKCFAISVKKSLADTSSSRTKNMLFLPRWLRLNEQVPFRLIDCRRNQWTTQIN